MRKATTVVLACILFVGCFPLTVDVGPDGRVLVPREEGVFAVDLAKGEATLIHRAEAGKGHIWARWSPDGKKALSVLADEQGGGQEFWTANADGTEAKKLYSPSSPAAYALWSPDGKSISVGLGAEQPQPKIVILNAADGKVVQTIEGAFPTHAWTPDSKNIVAFKAEEKIKKEEGGEFYTGAFGLFVVGGEGFKADVQAICPQDVYLALSADNSRLAFVAVAAADPGAKISFDGSENAMLFECDIQKGERHCITETSGGWAAYSPDGKRLAYSVAGEKTSLCVKDIAGGEPKTVAENIATGAGGMMGPSAKILPVWLSDSKILFWRDVATLGTGGKALTAFEVNADGTGLRNVQVVVDTAVLAAGAKESK